AARPALVDSVAAWKRMVPLGLVLVVLLVLCSDVLPLGSCVDALPIARLACAYPCSPAPPLRARADWRWYNLLSSALPSTAQSGQSGWLAAWLLLARERFRH